MATTQTWMPDGLLEALPNADLVRMIEKLRAEVAELRGALARETRERTNAGPSRQTSDFGKPAQLAPAPDPRPAPLSRDGREVAPFDIPPSGGGLARPDQGIDFGAVQRLSPEELDALPYGLITLDARGRVIHYNDTESRMVGLPKHKVIGRSFFGEVAPCTKVREFEGRFEELVRDPYRVRVQTFDFVFRFANGEQQVTIVMTPAKVRGQYNLALLRRQLAT